jgi:hypothetical protein
MMVFVWTKNFASDGRRWMRLGIVLATVILVALLAWRFVQFILMAVAAVRFPFQLDYGEGIVWQQAMLIPGPRMYGDITQYPFLVFHYPPVYHLLLHALATFGLDALIAGRSLSLAASMVIGLCAGVISFSMFVRDDGKPVAWIAAICAALVTWSTWPFEIWAPLLRVDMLALAFNFLGMTLAIRAAGRPSRLYLAMTCFVFAVYTKQTAVLAPLSTMSVMAIAFPRPTIKALGFGLGLGIVVLVALTWSTAGGFPKHIFQYNLNRFNFQALLNSGRSIPSHLIYFAMACVGIFVGWRLVLLQKSRQTLLVLLEDLKTDAALRVLASLTIYMICTTLSLGALAKSGSYVNYLIEPMCVWSISIGLVVGRIVSLALNRRMQGAMDSKRAFFIVLLLAMQVVFLPRARNPILDDREQIKALAKLEQAIQAAPKAVLSDDMVLLMKADKGVPWEPAIFAELASLGQWDETLIIRLIRSRAFAFVATIGQKGDYYYDSRFSPAVDAAISEAYPLQEVCAGHLIRRPAN